jgi:hypothetical protein
MIFFGRSGEAKWKPPSRPPIHPGVSAKNIARNFGYEHVEDVAKATGIDEEKLSELFNKNSLVDQDIVNGYEKIRPGTGNLLRKLSTTYDFYDKNGKWPIELNH